MPSPAFGQVGEILESIESPGTQQKQKWISWIFADSAQAPVIGHMCVSSETLRVGSKTQQRSFPASRSKALGYYPCLCLPIKPDYSKMCASPLPMVEEKKLYRILQYVAHGSLTQPSSPFTIQVLLVLQPEARSCLKMTRGMFTEKITIPSGPFSFSMSVLDTVAGCLTSICSMCQPYMTDCLLTARCRVAPTCQTADSLGCLPP